MRWILLGLMICASPAGAQRGYWKVPLDSFALGKKLHTHIEITGVVAPNFPVREADGDIHIKILSPLGTGRFIVAECIPKIPCPLLPRAGQTVTVRGVSRLDPEHGWREVHPVESLVVTVMVLP